MTTYADTKWSSLTSWILAWGLPITLFLAFLRLASVMGKIVIVILTILCAVVNGDDEGGGGTRKSPRASPFITTPNPNTPTQQNPVKNI